MKKDKIEKIEDIYPLTIINMRYGGKIIIFNLTSGNPVIHEAQSDEEPHYGLEEWMEDNLSQHCYGIGDTIYDAFEDYKRRYYGYNKF